MLCQGGKVAVTQVHVFLSKSTGSTEDGDAVVVRILLFQLKRFSVLDAFISLMHTAESKANALRNQVQQTVPNCLPIAKTVVRMFALAQLGVLAHYDAGAKEGRAAHVHVVRAVKESMAEVGGYEDWGRFDLVIVIHHHRSDGGRSNLGIWCSLDSIILLVDIGGWDGGVLVDALLLVHVVGRHGCCW